MTVDNKELIELYKITLEQARHHGAINMQIYMGLGIITSVLLAAVGFLFGDDLHLCPQCAIFAKVGILVFFSVVLLFFGWTFCRIRRQFNACKKVLREIEKKLTVDQRTNGTSKFEGLLVGRELTKIEGSNRILIYIIASSLGFAAVCCFLFKCV